MSRKDDLWEEMLEIAKHLSDRNMDIHGREEEPWYNVWPKGRSSGCHEILVVGIHDRMGQLRGLAYAIEHHWIRCPHQTRGLILWSREGEWDEGIWRLMIDSFKQMKKANLIAHIMLLIVDQEPREMKL